MSPDPVPTTNLDPVPSPPPPPVHWYQSQGFIMLVKSTVIFSLGWLLQALTSDAFDWKALAIAVLGNVLLVLNQWWSPTIIAPFQVLNKKNVQ